jgi:hypothetical protein
LGEAPVRLRRRVVSKRNRALLIVNGKKVEAARTLLQHLLQRKDERRSPISANADAEEDESDHTRVACRSSFVILTKEGSRCERRTKPQSPVRSARREG